LVGIKFASQYSANGAVHWYVADTSTTGAFVGSKTFGSFGGNGSCTAQSHTITFTSGDNSAFPQFLPTSNPLATLVGPFHLAIS